MGIDYDVPLVIGTYAEAVPACATTFVDKPVMCARLEPSAELIKKVDEFSRLVEPAKQMERHHRTDGKRIGYRFYEGTLGIMAFAEAMGRSLDDWKIGSSLAHNDPDFLLWGIRAGCKTASLLTPFQLVDMDDDRRICQLMCFVSPERNVVYVAGLATPRVMREFSSFDAIYNSDIRNQGKKQGFFGHHMLLKPRDIDEMRSMCEENNLLPKVLHHQSGRAFTTCPAKRRTREGLEIWPGTYECRKCAGNWLSPEQKKIPFFGESFRCTFPLPQSSPGEQ